MDVADGEHGGVTGSFMKSRWISISAYSGLLRRRGGATGACGSDSCSCVDHPARTVVVRDGLAALLAAVDEHVHVGLGIVADRRALAVRHRITQVLREQLRVAKQLLHVVADLGEPDGTPFALMVARVSARN